MPTKKELQEKMNELQEKMNELEIENKKLKEENEKNDELLNQGLDMCNTLIGFIKVLKLWDIFLKTMDKGELDIDEVKDTINNISAECSDDSCSKEC